MKGILIKLIAVLVLISSMSSVVYGDEVIIDGQAAYYGAPIMNVTDEFEKPKFAIATELVIPDISQEECVDCHEEEAEVFGETIHNANEGNEDPVYCLDCHLAGDSYFTSCEAGIINPKSLVIQRQTLSCNSECHVQVDEIQEGDMWQITACDYCHEVRDMTEENRLGHRKPMEEICSTCHIVTPGDTNALPPIHRIMQHMLPGISEAEEGEEIPTELSYCIDCHMYNGVDDEEEIIFTHTFGFNEEEPGLSCGQEGCHVDIDDEWAGNWIDMWKENYEEPPELVEPEGISNPLVFAAFILGVGLILFKKYY